MARDSSRGRVLAPPLAPSSSNQRQQLFRYKVMDGAFLGVHRGDAELFKLAAAVRSLSPDTHGVCPHHPLRLASS